MDPPQKKRYAEKQPLSNQPKNKPKPKYVPKEEAQALHQAGGTDAKKYKESHHQKKRKYQDRPELDHRQSSDTGFHCTICSENIRNRDAIWNCSSCCISLHLRCIKQWIRKTNEEDEPGKKKKLVFSWQCIQCKSDYNEQMPDYFCFCGKQKNPEYDPDLEAHSCGQPCQKKRGTLCPHPCPDACHSGKCRPCEHEGATLRCHCGKTQRTVRCSEDRPVFQCGKKCEKVLTCGKHSCERNCHQGPCFPCKKKHLADCYCGKNSDVIDCADNSYGCGEPCEKTIDCGYHKCEQTCHKGPCMTCLKKPELQTTCPCGRYSLLAIAESVRESCKDPIPSCGMPCKKKLHCGHECPLTCHEGRCPECKVGVQQSCRCLTAVRKIQCWKTTSNKFPFHCEAVCKKKRICGIHTCNVTCCEFKSSPIPADHPCELTCQKVLNCEKHTCDMPCHAGLCKKCPVIYSQPQPCPCGKTSMRPPIVCGTLTPECGNLCQLEMQCGHQCKERCHYGPCRCEEEVFVKCRCGNEMIKTTCGKSALCMKRCKKTLACGHVCQVQCHPGDCEDTSKVGCKKKCDQTRKNCGHKCRQICHPARACEDYPCEAQILIKCECGHRQTSHLCGASSSTGQKVRKQIKCNKKCQNLKRFDILYKGKEIYYPNQLVQFGFKNFNYLRKIEDRLEKFILESDENFIEIDFKMVGDNPSKNALMNLFENHYHLNTHFYRHMKTASFTLMQGEDTMIPKPCLTEYIKQISKGIIKRTSLPFEYTIKFDGDTKERLDPILRSLKNFLHQYYVERKDRMMHAHFWNKEEGIKAKNYLEGEHVTIEFYGEENLNKMEEEEYIDEEDIIDREIEETSEITKQVQPTEKTQQTVEEQVKNEVRQSENTSENVKKQEAPTSEAKQQVTGEKREEIPSPVAQNKGFPAAEAEKPRKIIPVEKKKPKIIMRSLNFIKSEYPPASEHTQEMYQIDEDELFGEKVDWDKLIEKLRASKMGIEASEWRIRAIIMIGSFHPVSEKILNEEFDRLFKMYEKDKEKAKRILSLQKIDFKNIQEEMKKNQIYLSEHEPEIVSYFLIFSALAADKLEYVPSEECVATPEVHRALQLINSLEQGNFDEFSHLLSISDYLTSCCLVPMVHEARRKFINLLNKNKRLPYQGHSAKGLLFDEEQQLLDFCKKNGLIIEKRLSKSKKEEQWIVVEGEATEQCHQDDNFLNKIHEKRDKKYFLCEPEQLINQKWMTRSFFCFGDFKESVHSKYMLNLGRQLRDG